MTLKDRIKELADKENLSLPALESKLGFGNGTITKWDKSTPNADKLNAVAQHFNVTMDYLLNGSSKEQQNLPNINNTIVENLTEYLNCAPLEIHIAKKLYTCDADFICNININDEHYCEVDNYFREKLDMPILTLQEILNAERFISSKDLTHIVTGLNIPIEKLLHLPTPPYTIAKDTFIKASFLKEGYFLPLPGIFTMDTSNNHFILAISNNDALDCFNININAYNTFISRVDDFISSNIEQLISKSI